MNNYSKEYLEQLDKKTKLVPLIDDFIFKNIIYKNTKILINLIFEIFKDIEQKKPKIKCITNEMIKKSKYEDGKILDICISLDGEYIMDVEFNSICNKNTQKDNLLYKGHLITANYEIGNKYRHMKDTCFYRLNLYKSSLLKNDGNAVFMYCDIENGEIVSSCRMIINENLKYYYDKFYNDPSDMSYAEIFLGSLLSNSLVELNEFTSKILNEKDRNNFLENVIKVNNELSKFYYNSKN